MSEQLPVQDLAAKSDSGDLCLPTEMASYCVSCGDDGVTRFLRREIPFFHDVTLAAFECEHCGFRSSDLYTMEFQERGVHIELDVTEIADLDREVVRTEYASIAVPEVELEIPFNAGRKGEISTVEGIISKTAESLEQEQPVRKICEPDIAVKIDNFIQKLKSLLDRSGNQRNFTFVIDDPTGNSFVQNILAPLQDPKCKSRSYTRSREQCEIIGLSVPPYEENSDEKEKENNQELSQNEKETNKDQYKSEFNIAHLSKIQLSTLESQVLKVASPEDIVEMVLPCSCCSNQQGIMRTITASIPLFKQIVLMAYSCEQCGYRNCEVTPAGEISQKGKKYSLTVTRKEDLNRDVLKSDSAFLIIPQLGFEMATGTLGGVFTTVEGILIKAKERLEQVSFVGDSATKTEKNKFSAFIQAIDSMSKMSEGPFTIILNDPLGNSYIQDLFYPNPDPYLFVEEYIRTSEQNEELGLNDMKIEGYEEDEGKEDQQE